MSITFPPFGAKQCSDFFPLPPSKEVTGSTPTDTNSVFRPHVLPHASSNRYSSFLPAVRGQWPANWQLHRVWRCIGVDGHLSLIWQCDSLLTCPGIYPSTFSWDRLDSQRRRSTDRERMDGWMDSYPFHLSNLAILKLMLR